MSKELEDFEYFKKYQLLNVDFITGTIDCKSPKYAKKIYKNVGSKNPDGYIRLWCRKSLRMKHRLIYYLYHNELPEKGSQIDHFDRDRANNSISNLRILSVKENNGRALNRKIPRYTPDKIHAICKDLTNTSISDNTIAILHGVTRATVRDIKVRRSRQKISKYYSWEHRGY